MKLKYVFTMMLVWSMTCSFAFAADWPQFRGPNRDGKSAETGLLKQWPEGGPKMLWSVDGLGEGWPSVAVADGMIYTTGMVDKEGVLFAMDLDGKPLWQQNYGPEWTRSFPGVRCTPTVHDGRVYVISGVGQVGCFDAKTGEKQWLVDPFNKYGGQYGAWGISESPLIIDGKVVFTVGGKDAVMVALDAKTGGTVWAAPGVGDKSSYCSPALVQAGGRKVIVNMLGDSVIAVDAADGTLLWRDLFKDYLDTLKDINPVSPIAVGSQVYTTSGYDCGGAMYQLSEDGAKFTRTWVDTTLDCHHGGVLEHEGYIYGANWRGNGDGSWCCLDWKTGDVKYETHWICKGSILYADGMLYCYEEKKGTLGLVKATPEGFAVVSSFEVPLGKGKHWSHPAISDGRLYVRHGEVLMSYDITEPSR